MKEVDKNTISLCQDTYNSTKIPTVYLQNTNRVGRSHLDNSGVDVIILLKRISQK